MTERTDEDVIMGLREKVGYRNFPTSKKSRNVVFVKVSVKSTLKLFFFENGLPMHGFDLG